MKSINKIRERDLDESLLKTLLSSGHSVNIDQTLSNYLKKTDIIAESSIPSSYTKKLQDQIQKLQAQLDNLSSKYGSSGSASGTTAADIDSLKKRVAALEAALNAFKNADGTSIADTVRQHTGQIQSLQSIATSLQQEVDDLQKKLAAIPDANKLNNLSSRVDDLEKRSSMASADDLNNTYRRLDNPISENDMDEPTKKIIDDARNVSARLSILENTGQAIYGGKGQFITFNDKSEKEAIDLFHNNFEYCNTTAEATYVMNDNDTDDDTDIYDASTKTLYRSNPNYKEGDTSSQAYIGTQNLADYLDYANSFVLDDNLNKIRFIMDGQFVEPFQSVFSRTTTVAAGQSAKVARDKSLSKPPVVFMVKDTEAGSRTNGKYINAEGIATIAYEDSGYTIYNDDEASHDFLILGSE